MSLEFIATVMADFREVGTFRCCLSQCGNFVVGNSCIFLPRVPRMCLSINMLWGESAVLFSKHVIELPSRSIDVDLTLKKPGGLIRLTKERMISFVSVRVKPKFLPAIRQSLLLNLWKADRDVHVESISSLQQSIVREQEKLKEIEEMIRDTEHSMYKLFDGPVFKAMYE